MLAQNDPASERQPLDWRPAAQAQQGARSTCSIAGQNVRADEPSSQPKVIPPTLTTPAPPPATLAGEPLWIRLAKIADGVSVGDRPLQRVFWRYKGWCPSSRSLCSASSVPASSRRACAAMRMNLLCRGLRKIQGTRAGINTCVILSRAAARMRTLLRRVNECTTTITGPNCSAQHRSTPKRGVGGLAGRLAVQRIAADKKHPPLRPFPSPLDLGRSHRAFSWCGPWYRRGT